MIKVDFTKSLRRVPMSSNKHDKVNWLMFKCGLDYSDCD